MDIHQLVRDIPGWEDYDRHVEQLRGLIEQLGVEAADSLSARLAATGNEEEVVCAMDMAGDLLFRMPDHAVSLVDRILAHSRSTSAYVRCSVAHNLGGERTGLCSGESS